MNLLNISTPNDIKRSRIIFLLFVRILNSEMSVIFVVIFIMLLSPFYMSSAPGLALTQARDSTILTELDMMVMVKRKFLTTQADSNWKSSWISNMMKTIPSQESMIGPNSDNSENSMFQYNHNFPYGIIARKGILMQMK